MTKSAKDTALVTGASSGIGAIYADRLARRGYDLILVARNRERLDGLAKRLVAETGRSIEIVAADLSKRGDVSRIEAILRDNAGISVLVNNAGVGATAPLLASDVDKMSDMIALNVDALMRLTYAAVPGFVARGGGTIVNMSSLASSMKGVPNRCVYGASKAAVIGLTKAVAADYVTQGIRCNAICPGTVDSPSLHDRLRATGDYDAAMVAFINRQPMGRIAQPEEIAALVVYLASDESAYVSGQAIAIDGGWSI